MLKRFRSKPPHGSRLLRDITMFSAATGSVHRRSHLQLLSYPPLRISYGKTNHELQLMSHWHNISSMSLLALLYTQLQVPLRRMRLNSIQHALRFANQDVAQAGNATNKLILVFI
ncbi:hypothetical protein Bca4012_043754 [Brassica carinata]|uniref:Uncharacterized protein n=1 Tax=Brassica carinata TaxID=52824 RepID=A0A8X7QUQ5_BRACI|nr:hypothetical protein Bca52824_058628 [Brassica carinata]